MDGGGQLAIEHDVDGPLRIIDDYGYLVWERCTEPWAELFGRGVRQIADAAIEATEQACRRHGINGETEVFSLMLSILGDSSLDFAIYLGLGADRRQWLASAMNEEMLSEALWHLDREAATPHIVPGEAEIVPSELGRLMLQEGGLNQPDDARTLILNAVAGALSRHDWQGVMTPTDDFVVYRMGHDEGLRWAYESVRAANPAERVAAWERNWPPGVPRGEND
jgi:hypothetical protein